MALLFVIQMVCFLVLWGIVIVVWLCFLVLSYRNKKIFSLFEQIWRVSVIWIETRIHVLPYNQFFVLV